VESCCFLSVSVDYSGEKIVDHGPIETKTLADVPQDAYNLPSGFEWCEVDMTDPMQVDQVYDLLAQNYVEDDDAMFRFDYSREFLRWALMPPGFRKEFHIAVRGIANKKLFGFITGIPAQIRVYEQCVLLCLLQLPLHMFFIVFATCCSINPMVEINFLCVHKKLRAKRLGPVLIKEITRRVNLTGVWQAVYTAGALIPKPVAKNRYYHRSLNPKKLIEIGFSRLSAKMTLSATIKLYRLPTVRSCFFLVSLFGFLISSIIILFVTGAQGNRSASSHPGRCSQCVSFAQQVLGQVPAGAGLR
jgi:glycylpeptide N-tetradecanoyltransferase